ncbi:alpha/beta hydrolase family protein [Effusibacillus consociatus]|uniref:Alpha/beta hydrolase family protein n=1 Tax=Effusibacillus consociatus TaxID=1117041 RepID=A0ABV9PVS7_9BACL
MIDQVEIPEFHPYAELFLVTYLSQGLRVKGYLAIPAGEGPFPLLVYCRGGIRNVGMTRLAWVSRFVSEGYIVFAPFYRGNRGGEGREDFGGEDRHDVLDALSWLSELSQVNKSEIHLFGFSRGAIMALFAAMEFPFVKSVIVWGGVSDLALTYEERIDLRRMLKRVVGDSPQKVPEAYAWRSPIYRVDELSCPVLLVHGTKDEQVGIEHSLRLAAALKDNGKTYTCLFYEGWGHFFSAAVWEEAFSRMFQWCRGQ